MLDIAGAKHKPILKDQRMLVDAKYLTGLKMILQ